jgi:hypothetical protein
MNVLDENFPDDQRRLLLGKRVHVQMVGRGLGRRGLKDDGIIPLLHQMVRPTFFTLDEDFHDRRLFHRGYYVVHLDVDDYSAADYVRRVLRHRDLNSKTKRMGLVIQVQPTGLTFWRINQKKVEHLEWD